VRIAEVVYRRAILGGGFRERTQTWFLHRNNILDEKVLLRQVCRCITGLAEEALGESVLQSLVSWPY